MRNAGLEEAQAGIKIAGRNINKLRYADDTTLMAESEVREGIRGHTDWNHNHRQQANLITRTTALSNSVKLSHAVWGHPRRVGHDTEVWQNVVHWRREWQTTSVFLPWEPREQYETFSSLTKIF